MTSRERLMITMRNGQADRVPCTANTFAPSMFELAGEEMAARLIQEMDVLLDVHVVPDAEWYLGAEYMERRKIIEEGNIVTEIIDTPKGPLRQVLRRDPGMLDWCEEHWFKDESDVEKFLSFPYRPPQPDMTELNYWQERLGDEGIAMVVFGDAVCLPGLWFRPNQFMLQCMDNLPMIQDLLEVANERVKDFIVNAAKLGVEVFRFSGAELTAQNLMGPGWFEKLVFPYDKELVDVAHEHGCIAYTHCHGKVSAFLDGLADTGTDALDCLEREPLGDMTLREAKERIGDRVCLSGNLDDFLVIASKSSEEVRQEAIDCIRQAGEGGGYILGGTASGMYTPEMAENFLVMAEVAREYGTYPLSL